MPVQTTLNARVPVKIWTDRVEPEAMQQLRNTASLPFVFRHVAAMADVHLGKGATVGSVVATKGAVCPAAVGVDIGCGMMARKTSIPADRLDGAGLKKLRHSIEREIPVGFEQKREPFDAALDWMGGRAKPHAASEALVRKAVHQLGTLGGGNHFIELAEDGDGAVWLTLHSGSRGVGNRIGSHYIKVAQQLCASMGVRLPDRDLAYLPQDHPAFAAYLRDLNWAQQFALHNRNEMMDRILAEVRHTVYGEDKNPPNLELQRINSHHNFTQEEQHFGSRVWVTRKGAIEARRSNWAMIPGSMGTRSYIVVGKEHPMSFHSAPHGAGRRYSRTKARALFGMDDLSQAMAGIEYRHSKVLLDEIPAAYKNIDEVMDHARDLVEVKYVLKQFVNVKGD